MARVATDLPDPDRWMALGLVVWHHAVAQGHDRAGFRRAFIDTRQAGLMQALGLQLPRSGKPPDEPGQHQPLRRVAIVASHMSVGTHAGTALVLDLRAILEGTGISTHVFAAQELAQPAMGSYFAGSDRSTVVPAQPSTWRLRTVGPAQISLASEDFSFSSRWAGLIPAIGRFDPDVVLFVGLSSPLVWSLQRDYPVVGMSLHTVAPLAPVDVWLAADPQTGKAMFWPDLPAPQIAHFPFRFWPAQPGATASREALGIPQEAILLASSGHRLYAEMPDDWKAALLAFLETQPQVYWLLIGVPTAMYAASIAQHPRIRCLEEQDDLAVHLRMADIYINPPRLGGGASVAMAMNLGLPVLCMAGSDGGDKVGDLAVDHTDVYIQRLAEWIADAGLRQQAGATLQQKFKEELDISRPDAALRLVQACRLAQSSFEHRKDGPRPHPTE
jgi:hypothetical protein